MIHSEYRCNTHSHSMQLERLNKEAATRTKHARRRANEIKQRTIQRMQLRMVAPLDIGLEQTDLQLGVGQDDVFDLDNVERGLKKRRDVARLADGEMGDDASSNSEPGDRDGASDDEEFLDSDEERERKVKDLEDELDGLYDTYRTKLAERDAKFRIKEARKKNTMRDEEWGGVGATGADADQSDDEEEESEGDGGYDNIARRKAAGDGGSDSDSDEDEPAPTPRKRRKLANGKGLITSLDDQPKHTSSKATQVWFSQDLFAGAPDVEDIEDEEGDEDEEDAPETSGSQDADKAGLKEVCVSVVS
jgi:AdoMet-dependent rRNA methyltransferase SPB1